MVDARRYRNEVLVTPALIRMCSVNVNALFRFTPACLSPLHVIDDTEPLPHDHTCMIEERKRAFR